MRFVYGLVVLIETALVGMCAVKTEEKKDDIGRSVFIYELLSFVCAIVFCIFTFVPGITITTLCEGLRLALYDWILISLTYYTQIYTREIRTIKIIQIFTILFAMADTYKLIENTWTHSIFHVASIADEHIKVVYEHDSLWYQLHYTYTYAFILILLFIYMYMIIRASKIYKKGYLVIAAVIFLGFAFDVMTIGSDSIYNISMLIYGFMTIMIYYLTFRYVPNELIENMLSLVVSDMNNGIVFFNSSGRCVYSNELMNKIYNFQGINDGYEEKYQRWLSDTKDTRQDSMAFETPIKVNGEKRYYEIVYKRIYDEKARFLCDYFIYNDRSHIYDSWKKEKYKASHDSLTGLLNREQFYQDVHQLVNQYSNEEFCIICSNIKDFKFINEMFGMEKGNQLLIKQSELMRRIESENTLCARMLNDRFAICMPKRLLDEDKIEAAVRELQKEFSNNSFHFHMYMGVYDIKDKNEDVSIMCDKANIAGDTIKHSYDCCVARYDKHLLEISIEERRIIGEFDKALESNEFVMYLQPQVDRTGKALGAEALVRWQHPKRGLLAPGTFINIIENAGLIYKLDRVIWEQAASRLALWKKDGHEDYHISVNISTKDFYILDIFETFSEIVKKYNISPKQLKLEITETTLMSDFDKTIVVLRKLQRAGFNIEIDDFGSGYSSLNMLKDIEADVLKIDMGFLRQTENEIKGQDILESVINLAGKIGMVVITEGVETKEQLNMLSNMGCGLFQGYYFSKPIPIDEFERKYLK